MLFGDVCQSENAFKWFTVWLRREREHIKRTQPKACYGEAEQGKTNIE